MPMKRGIIFAGGEFAVNDIVTDNSIIVCADSGYDSAILCGITPNVVIGDMDSVKNHLPDGIEKIKLNCEKDDTDTQAAIDYLCDKGCSEILLLGALGGRIDHEIGNIMLTVYALKKGVKLTIKDDKTEIFAVEKEAEFEGDEGDIVSIIPIEKNAEGVTLSGLKYTLKNATMQVGKTLGISNEFLGGKAKITVKKGIVLVIKVKR